VNGKSAPLVTTPFALSDVYAGPDPDTAGCERGYEIKCASSRLSGAVEKGKDAVAGVFRAASAVLGQQLAHQFVMRIELMTPAIVSRGHDLLSTANNVGEQHRCQNALTQSGVCSATDEFKGFGGKGIINVEGSVGTRRQCVKGRTWDTRG
jgi:hypothetical protein